MILGIDTSAGQCAVALVGARVWARAEAMDRGHAEALQPMAEAVLAEAGAVFGDITKIGVSTGPGSFTGVRIGVAFARGLGLALGVPAVGVTRFEALADPEGGTVRLPGRGGQVWVQTFGPGPVALGDPRVEPGDAVERLADPERIARIAAVRDDAPRPAPLYLRPADAAPPREAPPVMLD